jgi:8-oxo-dGTP pyrophosphatase MutT (NUDIX family)
MKEKNERTPKPSFLLPHPCPIVQDVEGGHMQSTIGWVKMADYLPMTNNSDHSDSTGEPRRRCAGGIILDRSLKHIILVKSRASGKWGIPKGGLEINEPAIDGAIREIYEECGLEIKSPCVKPMAPCITFRGVRIFLFCYNAPIETSKLKAIDNNEIVDCGWFSLEDLILYNLSNAACRSSTFSLETPKYFEDIRNVSRLPDISFSLDGPLFEDLHLSRFDGNLDGSPLSMHFSPENSENSSSADDTFQMTTLLRDLLKERLDAVIKKIHANLVNYQVIDDKLVINNYLAMILEESKNSDSQLEDVIQTIQQKFPMVFYLPELAKVLVQFWERRP